MAYLNDSREAQKEKLRKNIITHDNTGKDALHPSPVVFIIIAVIAAAVAAAVYFGNRFSLSTSYSVSWSRSIEGGDSGQVETFKAYRSFAGGIIKYTKDGAEYIDSRNKVVWERSYQLNTPIIDTCDKYAVIADQGSTQLYIFDQSALTGSVETLLPISLVRVADNGVVYAVLNDSNAEYITAFRPDGSAIDLSVKSIVSGDGYPFDIDVSPDGTELITSYLAIDGGQLVNNIVFRNFGSIGQNEDARRIVGGFKDEFAGHMTGYVHFSTNEYSQAFYDGGAVFFSTEVLNSPEITASVSYDDKIESVACSDSIAAVITAGEGNDAERVLHIYSNKGAVLSETVLDDKYTDISAADDSVLMRSGNNIRVYGKNGSLKADLEFAEGDAAAVTPGNSSREMYVITAAEMYAVRY